MANENSLSKLYIFRHGLALDREIAARDGMPDEERPLVSEKKTIRAARGFRHLIDDLSVIISSEYLRARQTAKILLRLYPNARYETLEALKIGGNHAAIVSMLADCQSHSVCLVGHEPELSAFISECISDSNDRSAAIRLRKAGAAALNIESISNKKIEAELDWLLTAKQLRILGDVFV